MGIKTILHIDMDAFFASIEVARAPELKGKPVIVGGNPNSRGVVSTCSYEARAFGVRSAMSLSEAKRRCPHAIFIEGSYRLYREYSDKIMALFLQWTHQVEIVSIDEAYLDVTDLINRYPNPRAFGAILKEQVYVATQLSCSVGIASNKMMAKIASGLSKPGGLYDIPHGEEECFLAPLPIQTLPGVGEKTQIALNADGFSTIADLQKVGVDRLIHDYGARGYDLYLSAHGKDNRSVHWEEYIPKSVGSETTFDKDQTGREILLATLYEQAERAWRHLCVQKMRTRVVTLKLRDSSFKTITRARSLYADSNNLQEIKEVLLDLFDENYQEGVPIRLIGVSLRKLTERYWQPTFWQ